MDSNVGDLRKWLHQRRLAEAREKAVLRDNPPDPASALTRGLALIDFAAKVSLAAPSASTAAGVSAEDLMAYRRWALIRNASRVA
jgi:hypothetical protein